MVVTTLAAASRTASCNAIVDQLDAAAGALKIYTGSAPDPDSAATGTLLVEWTLPNPAFGAASDDGTNATATAESITAVNAGDTGTAGYFRVENNGGTCLWQGTVGTSGADMNLDTLSIISDREISITSWTFSAPQS